MLKYLSIIVFVLLVGCDNSYHDKQREKHGECTFAGVVPGPYPFSVFKCEDGFSYTQWDLYNDENIANLLGLTIDEEE